MYIGLLTFEIYINKGVLQNTEKYLESGNSKDKNVLHYLQLI